MPMTKPSINAATSRRQVLRGTVAFSAAAAFDSTALLTGAKADTPNKGGTLRYGVGHGSTTDSLDPGTYENNFTQALDFMLHNHLAEVTADGELVPELAESWSASDDASQWTFEVRKGVEFHNGKSITSDDVVASVNHHRGEESRSAAKALLEAIVDVKADGSQKVVVKLKAGNADFPWLLSDYHIPILPSADGKVDATSGVGAGGYALDSFEPGIRAVVKRNPNYWKSDRAHFDSIEMTAIVDVVARTNALSTGEIDLMDRCDLKTVHLLERNDNLAVNSVSGSQHYTFPMRTDTVPFDNNEVRQALKLAVDREEMVQKILKGHGTVGNDHPISPGNQYHDASLEQRVYDPEKAKWHMKNAGLSSLSVPLSAADAAFGGAVDAAVLYKESAGIAGIEIDVVREPNDGYWSNVWMNKPWCACYWSGRPTPDAMFSEAYSKGAAWNDTFWNDDSFNALLVEGRAELDQAKRREMYAEMQQILRDRGGVVVPMFANYVFAATNKLKHSKLASNWDVDGQKFSERWWFA